MKNSMTATIIFTTLLTTNSLQAHEYGVDRSKPQIYQNTETNISSSICESILQKDKKRFHSILKTNKLKLRYVFFGSQCEGKNLLAYSLDNNAVKISKFIINRLPKNILTQMIYLLDNQVKLTRVAEQKMSNWDTTQG